MALYSEGGYLTTTVLPVTAMPFTVGLWFKALHGGPDVCYPWTLYRSGGGGADSYSVIISATTVQAAIVDAGAADTLSITSSDTGWCFLLARFISTTSRRLALLTGSEGLQHASGTTAVNPAGLTTQSFHAEPTPVASTNGALGEFWITNTDVQADGAAIQPALMQQLAYGGPFSVPHVAKSIKEYLCYRTQVVSIDPDDVGYKNYTVNSTPIYIGPHPPLPHWYRRRNTDRMQVALV